MKIKDLTVSLISINEYYFLVFLFYILIYAVLVYMLKIILKSLRLKNTHCGIYGFIFFEYLI